MVPQLVKNPPAMRVDLGSIPGLGRYPGEGKGYPLQYSGLENSVDSPWGHKDLDMAERLSVQSIRCICMLLSHFSRVRLCTTPQTAAHQAPPSLEFSRQEHWSGLPFPSPMHASESEVAQSCPTLSDSMDCSPPGSSIHGIFQARVLEWGAIVFSCICIGVSKYMHECACVYMCMCVHIQQKLLAETEMPCSHH